MPIIYYADAERDTLFTRGYYAEDIIIFDMPPYDITRDAIRHARFSP